MAFVGGLTMMTVVWVLAAAVVSAGLMHLSWRKAWNMYNLGKEEGAQRRSEVVRGYRADYVMRGQKRY
jgi:hypothetical protein